MGSRKTRRRFSEEFKRESVRMLEAGERSGAAIAKSLGIDVSLLYRWRAELSESGKDAFRGNGNRTALEEENRLLKKRIKELEVEAEILKKASAYFAKHLG